MTSKDFKKIILTGLSEILKPKQFKKSGANFTFSNGDLVYFINLQSSQSSTANILKVTVNIEIASTLLAKLEDTSLPEKDIRHYANRIGSFLPTHQDKWWAIDSIETAQKASQEINTIISNDIFNLFEKLKTTNDLAELWNTEKAVRLTEVERKKYLDLWNSTIK